MKRNFRNELLAVGVAVLLCGWILWNPMGVRKCDLDVPISYRGEDDFLCGMYMKSVVDGGWALHNPLLAAPYEADFHDYPMSEGFSFLLIKLFGLFTDDFALLYNLYLLIHYPLTTLITYLVLRQFKLSYTASIVGGLLYTFLPYHYVRAIGQPFYGVYYGVPLLTMILLWIATGNLRAQDLLTRAGWQENKGKWRLCLLTCLLLGSSGWFHYAFFGLFLLGIVALLAVVRERSWRGFVVPAALSGVICLTLFVNVLPNLLYFAKHGRTNIAARQPSDAEQYGLKISLLLLPTFDHRIPALMKLKQEAAKNPLTTENHDSTLGIFGSLGFLLLLGCLLLRQRAAAEEEADETFTWLHHLSVLNMAAVLLGTIGGFGSLFALLVWAQIRGYNRISVYLAFFSFLALLLALEYLARRYCTQRWQQIGYHVLLLVILYLGLTDLLGRSKFTTASAAPTYQSDREFVQSIEAQLPPQAMIFQFPYAGFPTVKGSGKMKEYDHFRGYLHSSQLRWSFGAIRGRQADLWQQDIAAKPLAEAVTSLAQAGFSGIYVDRFGYEDNGKKLESELAPLLGAATSISRDERLVFYNLIAYAQKLRAEQPGGNWAAQQESSLKPLLWNWEQGFYNQESNPNESWRWCQAAGTLKVINPTEKERRVVIETAFSANADSNLEISGALFTETLRLNATPRAFAKTITVPPGEHVIQFKCDSPPVPPHIDSRTLVFRVNNFRWKIAE
jgi:phosphoglycerol transferase